MPEFVSDFAAKCGVVLAGLCAITAVFAPIGGATAASLDGCPPPTTVTVGPDGNPWHG
ncbi:hypothetical protein [Saccharothrix australiensis]|uniref:Uncharacterized protein n=1 Tax=Saccharothrix australiensis TaxID=2072 RepID=A0A495VU08_9PSEU|nr:hypothetical protein [Saccharothrix australiensis]RKT52829.1 hypothetical protein C8E97_1367 [Saccharothrix australiensis]